MALIKTPSLTGRFAQLLALAACLVLAIWLLTPSLHLQRHLNAPWTRPGLGSGPNANLPPAPPIPPEPHPIFDHPIDSLIRSANLDFEQLVARETNNLQDAARAYRERRGRQPPPHFDQWWTFAQNRSAVIIEEMFDRIYHDLNPFWGKTAKEIREPANTFRPRISIRNGVVQWFTPSGQAEEWNKAWSQLISGFAGHLPDVDLPINLMDEPRMVVEFDEINQNVQRGLKNRRIVPPQDLKDTYQSLSSLDQDPPAYFNPQFNSEGLYWKKALNGCPPDSPARTYHMEKDFSGRPPLTGKYPPHSFQGYVRNWTTAKSPCDNPRLQGLHGTFILPEKMKHTRNFWPIFGSTKLSVNNDILLPPATYLIEQPSFPGGDGHDEVWKKKKDQMIWRGTASGGRNKENNWTRFQRHRFLSMINATSVRAVETNSDHAPPNFVLPADNAYRLASMSPESKPGDLATWIATWGDGAFGHLLCDPPPLPPQDKTCDYTGKFYSLAERLSLSEQYEYKYLPDIDGNSFSGRYRGFLQSTSLPIKATIYQEWHDSRLIPWKHFVPMDNTFIDIYGIMEYFVGNEAAGVLGHDEEAKNIAIGGKKWADKVLRREDMEVYVYRLLLEYARLCDDDRETMGWKGTGQPDSPGDVT